jgi:cytochrome c peroxidase
VDLGRTLFFDPILSSTNDRSCASCHDPARAFTDGAPKSLALGRDGTLDRNAPTLINAVHSRRFFHDLRAMRVSDVVAHVLTNEREFNTGLLDVVGRLRTSDEYITMFSRAFSAPATSAIDPTNIGIAISAYLTTLVSFDSRVDRYLRGEDVTLSDSERRGFDLFMGKAACASCHFPPTFAGYVPPSFTESESEIIGVPLRRATEKAVADPDPGRAGGIVRENAVIYRGSFKTPTVRNVALTAPYFHNGSYDRLEDVVDFYVRGGGAGIGLSVPYQTLPFEKLELTARDQRDLVAFMEALTDTAGLTSRPQRLPPSSNPALNRRVVGGVY